jgi:osmotically-inducible protein OsmY
MGEKPLAARVQAALMEDRRTRHLAVDVTAIGAHVTLTGAVPSAKDRKQAEEVARAVPGVAAVLNDTRIGRNP